MKPIRSKARAAKRKAIAAHQAAKADLASHSDADSPEYLADHDRVVKTEKHVPWYRR